MWCKQCRQDVPAVASANRQQLCCSRCGWSQDRPEHVAAGAAPAADEDRASADATADGVEKIEKLPESDPPRFYDDWELDEQLRHIQRVIQGHYHRSPTGDLVRQEFARLDPMHSTPSPPSLCAASNSNSNPSDDGTLLSSLGWVALSAGMMVFVCGGVLLGWSVFSGRQDLWQLGMPITVAGQITLLVGLVLQLDRLWQASRDNANRLHQFDDRLWRLQSGGKPGAGDPRSLRSNWPRAEDPGLDHPYQSPAGR